MVATPVTETNAWDDVVDMPVDGDVGDADDFLASTVLPIINRTRYLWHRIVGLGSTSYRQLVPISDAVWHEMDVSDFLLKTDTTLVIVPHIEATGVAGGDFWIPLHGVLPPYGKITRFGINLYGATGHGALPSVMPVVELVRRANSLIVSVAPETIDTVADTSGDVSTYQGSHEVYKAVDHTIDPTRDYYIRVKGESGTNSAVGSIFLAPSIDIVGA